jgi:DNA-binding beta-propeller fold protein YncE
LPIVLKKERAFMYFAKWFKNPLIFPLILTVLILVSVLTESSSALAQVVLYISTVRIFDLDFALPNAAGLTFSPTANAFYLLADYSTAQPGGELANLLLVSPFADLLGEANLPPIGSPINMAYDSQANQLLLLDTAANELIQIKAGPNGPDPARIIRFPAEALGLQNPQGMTLDPASGGLFILDSAASEIVRVEPDVQHNYDPAGALAEGRISQVDLNPLGLGTLRGLAFNPSDGHLYVMNPVELKLYEVSQSGQLIATRNLSGLDMNFKDPQGLVFAPSGDATDDPAKMNLFLIDSGRSARTTVPEPGRIIEFNLNSPVKVRAAASVITASLVNTVDMSTWSPPSPDPSGLTYLPNSNRLMMVDGEVEETVSGITHFQGANVWEFTRSGSVLRTANISKVAPTVVPMTNEPTGVAWNPVNGHFYFSDDGQKEVFDLNPGTDGLVGTTDDSWTSFDTLIYGNADTEGLTVDTTNNRLFGIFCNTSLQT